MSNDREPEPPSAPDFDKLAALEYFDPKAFESADSKEQAVCDLVLMLALVYNNFKDLLWAFSNLSSCRQPDPFKITPYNGQYSGMSLHITRLLYSPSSTWQN